MASLDVSDPSSSHGAAIPDCPRCYGPARVSEVKPHELSVSRAIQVPGAVKGAVICG